MMRAGRIFIGLGALLAWGSLARIQHVHGMPYAPAGLDALPVPPAVYLVGTALFMIATLGWVTNRHPGRAAAGMALLLAVGAQVTAWQLPDQTGANGATMLPGASLTAWVIARRLAAENKEQQAMEAACGVVAAGYGIAVASKLVGSGLAWAGADNIGMQIATQAYLISGPIRALRLAAAASRPLCAALGWGTFAIEGGALLFVLPAARLPLAALIVGMHLGISLLMGLHHYDWMFTALGWALLSWGGGARASASDASAGVG